MAKEGMLGNIRAENASDRVVRDAKSPLKQRVKNAILTVLLLSGMTGVFAQATKTGKETLKKEPPIHIVANDSVDIAGFRVSQDEAKIYKDFEEARKYYDSDEELIGDYKKRISKERRTKQIRAELAAAKREGATLDQEITAIDNRIEAKKQEIAGKTKEEGEIEQENEQLKQQLFQAREKKLGRKLTEAEKNGIIKKE